VLSTTALPAGDGSVRASSRKSRPHAHLRGDQTL
jgi:hypothetical protein